MRALPQLLPERRVGHRIALGGAHEHAVMAAQDFIQGITHGIQEILVGHQDMAIKVEFDDRLRLMDGRDLTMQIGLSQCAVCAEQTA
ncbi:hypothetical protein D3C72_1936680 [compost metagenome]